MMMPPLTWTGSPRAQLTIDRGRPPTLIGAALHGLWNLYNLFNDPADMVVSAAISLAVLSLTRLPTLLRSCPQQP